MTNQEDQNKFIETINNCTGIINKEVAIKQIEAAIVKNADINYFSNKDNKHSRLIFTDLTGIKLPANKNASKYLLSIYNGGKWLPNLTPKQMPAILCRTSKTDPVAITYTKGHHIITVSGITKIEKTDISSPFNSKWVYTTYNNHGKSGEITPSQITTAKFEKDTLTINEQLVLDRLKR